MLKSSLFYFPRLTSWPVMQLYYDSDGSSHGNKIKKACRSWIDREKEQFTLCLGNLHMHMTVLKHSPTE